MVATVFVLAASRSLPADEFGAPLPAGVTAVWDLEKSYRETTPTRERICLNGLWRWQPAQADPSKTEPPKARWGYFKVPGCWPGISDYLQKDSQTLYRHPSWKDTRLGSVRSAWYEREFHVPVSWARRRIALAADYVNSIATVFIDGKHAGEIRFPGGELDITAFCRPDAKHTISVLVAAIPLNEVMLSYADTAAARQSRGTVARRGLCGDVFLESTPEGARFTQVRVHTSVRKAQIAFETALADLSESVAYTLRGSVRQGGREVIAFESNSFRTADVEGGRFTIASPWKPDKLWDIHTPGNVYSVSVSLRDDEGRVLDTALPERFGFREFWIDGRDFYLNGTRVFLSAVPIDNALVGAAQATYAGASETLRRLKSFGINMVYTHNYGCEPGSHLSYAEILRAADDAGMLVSFTQPHFSHYNWKAADADRANGYARHAEFYARAALNHPSVVFYSMSHNATGYEEDMNPQLIDGVADPREAWAKNNTKLALRAEAIMRGLDPGRIVYHHASGNLGSMHDSNFYPNFAPIQELSDWFEHWATKGVKPVFTCEYGAPFTWDWAMYRGWYKGQRSFGSAQVPWELCLAEWNAQFLGDRAYRLNDMEKANLRWEAKQFHAGKLWHRWDYPYEMGSRLFDDRHEVIGMYLADNLRAFRTWGVSATSPWEFGHFWRPRPGIDKRRRELKVDWNHLERPGFSPDFIDQPFDRMDMAQEPTDWNPTADGLALIRNNQPLLAYIAGKPARFTSKDHVFRPGETVEKQLVVLNNSRQTVTCECEWSLSLGKAGGAAAPVGNALTGRKRVTIVTGAQERIPLKLELPQSLGAGTFRLTARASFSTGESQQDSFAITVLPVKQASHVNARIALFDPEGATGALLASLGVAGQPVDSAADLAGYDILIVGKSALKLDRPAPSIDRVRRGLKVIVFEQTSQVLEKRLGFRVQEYGLRQVFPRVPDHPILSGIGVDDLRDWRGDATILSPFLNYELRPRYGPTVRWCDIPVPRIWRCGNQGNVASVLIEKPARGNFLPLVDGGFSLQYSPLLEYHEGKGLVLFCQLDVTGRTENDPVARTLVQNIISYVAGYAPVPTRSIVYAGDPAGLRHLARAGFKVTVFKRADLTPDQMLVAGPGAGKELAGHAKMIAQWLKAGGDVLGIGLDAEDAKAFLPFQVGMKNAEHISAYFEPFDRGSVFAGIGPADVHNRDPRPIALVGAGAEAVGNGVLARAPRANVVFCQLVPWQFEDAGKLNIKRTFRRASFLVSQLLTNLGAESATPLLSRFQSPVAGASEKRWLDGFYLDQPEEMDDPYRFFRW